MDKMAQPAPAEEPAVEALTSSEATSGKAATGDEVARCLVCQAVAGRVCYQCGAALCDTHSYREKDGTLDYCRACADQIVGVCDVCEALHARPCRQCGMKVCEDHQKRVIERWGWGGAPGQGGFTSWFPVLRTYCQEHGQNRFDVPKPTLTSLKGYDGSSPEW